MQDKKKGSCSILKKVAVKMPTEANPHPQGVFTKVKLPDVCADEIPF